MASDWNPICLNFKDTEFIKHFNEDIKNIKNMIQEIINKKDNKKFFFIGLFNEKKRFEKRMKKYISIIENFGICQYHIPSGDHIYDSYVSDYHEPDINCLADPYNYQLLIIYFEKCKKMFQIQNKRHFEKKMGNRLILELKYIFQDLFD